MYTPKFERLQFHIVTAKEQIANLIFKNLIKVIQYKDQLYEHLYEFALTQKSLNNFKTKNRKLNLSSVQYTS